MNCGFKAAVAAIATLPVGFVAPCTAGPLEDAAAYTEAVKWYRLSADQGNAKAQINLGFSYEQGRGVPQDYTEAVKWYRLAAGRGDAQAQNNLGVMYAKGLGVLQDYTEAGKWYRLAADQGCRAPIKVRQQRQSG